MLLRLLAFPHFLLKQPPLEAVGVVLVRPSAVAVAAEVSIIRI
jgi:hypothetical protein